MSRTPQIALGVGFGVFVAIMVLLLAPTVVKPKVPVYLPVAPGVPRDSAGINVDTLTVDAGDEHRWRFVDLDRGEVVLPPDTAGWDLMLRRFHFIPSGTVANLGRVAFEAAAIPPDTGYQSSRFARDTTNAATERWYTYSYFSHLLSPKRDVYALRTRDGRSVILQLLSYYCPGPTPGCVTFRYVYAPQRQVQSLRSAVTGSTLAARRAGSSAASNPAARSTSATSR
jgi:hypothetical protein